jgi:pimeloyl-ACP methyl ester carboxylesterase
MSGAPEWFERAIAVEPEHGSVTVDGAALETMSWGKAGARGLLLLHGNGAHVHWWRPFAPFFADDWRVGALSWSGMGGSERRSHYDFAVHQREVEEGAEALGLFDGPEKPWIVAHSFGAIPALFAVAAAGGTRFGGLIVVDSGYRPAPPTDPFRDRPAWRNPGYASREEGAARFRLSPAQDCSNRWMVDFIAARSLTLRDDGRWHWSFDPEADPVRGLAEADAVDAATRGAHCPLAYVYGQTSSLMSPELIAINRAMAPKGTPFVEIPDAAHHLMLDQPVAFVTALRALLPGR